MFVLVTTAACVSSLTYSGISAQSGHGNTSIAFLMLPLLALPLAIIGYLDDLYSLPSGLRYIVQILSAVAMICLSRLTVASLLVPFVLIAFSAVINFTNFMDGLDGLVASCMVIAFSALAFYLSAPWPIWALVGSLVGFLLWNWSPAKVFMGDVGSTFLGALYASLVLQASSWPEALGLLMVATPLLADACICVARRLHGRQKVFQAHRLHLYQRLHQAGWTHARVATVYLCATSVLAVALLTSGWLMVLVLSPVVLMVGVWLDQRLAVPFSVASQY